jgi:hypothetical protein
LIGRDAIGVRLEINAQREALITYRAGGQVKHVLAWGAVNAIEQARGAREPAFHLD